MFDESFSFNGCYKYQAILRLLGGLTDDDSGWFL
jgi:hypothetical protein